MSTAVSPNQGLEQRDFTSLDTRYTSKLNNRFIPIRAFFFWMAIGVNVFFWWFLMMGPMALLLFLPFTTPKLRSFAQKMIGKYVGICMYHAVVALEQICGTQIHLYGKDTMTARKENAIMLCNHPSWFDFLMIFAFQAKFGTLNGIRVILKSPIALVPWLGFVMQTAMYIFLVRDWSQDEGNFQSILEYYRCHVQRYQVLVFPEGTTVSEDRESVVRYHQKNNMKGLAETFAPRTLGFVQLFFNLSRLDKLLPAYPLCVPLGIGEGEETGEGQQVGNGTDQGPRVESSPIFENEKSTQSQSKNSHESKISQYKHYSGKDVLRYLDCFTEVDAIYDFSLFYQNTRNCDSNQLVAGRAAHHVHIKLKRYEIRDFLTQVLNIDIVNAPQYYNDHASAVKNAENVAKKMYELQMAKDRGEEVVVKSKNQKGQDDQNSPNSSQDNPTQHWNDKMGVTSGPISPMASAVASPVSEVRGANKANIEGSSTSGYGHGHGHDNSINTVDWSEGKSNSPHSFPQTSSNSLQSKSQSSVLNQSQSLSSGKTNTIGEFNLADHGLQLSRRAILEQQLSIWITSIWYEKDRELKTYYNNLEKLAMQSPADFSATKSRFVPVDESTYLNTTPSFLWVHRWSLALTQWVCFGAFVTAWYLPKFRFALFSFNLISLLVFCVLRVPMYLRQLAIAQKYDRENNNAGNEVKLMEAAMVGDMSDVEKVEKITNQLSLSPSGSIIFPPSQSSLLLSGPDSVIIPQRWFRKAEILQHDQHIDRVKFELDKAVRKEQLEQEKNAPGIGLVPSSPATSPKSAILPRQSTLFRPPTATAGADEVRNYGFSAAQWGPYLYSTWAEFSSEHVAGIVMPILCLGITAILTWGAVS